VLRGVERGAVAWQNAEAIGEELGTWLTSSAFSISLFLRHVKGIRIPFAFMIPPSISSVALHPAVCCNRRRARFS
jgi:hypothetical protein